MGVMLSTVQVKERIANRILEGIENRLCPRMADTALIELHCGAVAAFFGRKRREKAGEGSDSEEEGEGGGGDECGSNGAKQAEGLHFAALSAVCLAKF